MNVAIVGYKPSVECMGCDKPDQACVLLKTEGYTGWHCQRCVLREAKKRAGAAAPENGQPPAGLLSQQ